MLDKYVSVLVDAYPKPVRPTELAEKTGLSKPAVTKVRGRLMQLCSPKVMALDKGFLLVDDFNVFAKLFQIFAANGRHRQFFQSKFVRMFITSRPIHSKIQQVFPLYARYFDEQDTKFLVGTIIDIVSRLDPAELQYLMKSAARQMPITSDYRILIKLQKLIGDIHLSIRDDEELRRVLQIRDKLFFLTQDYLWGAVESMKILNELGQDERAIYISVYKHTIDFYLRQLFESFNEPIVAAATVSSIDMKDTKLDMGATVLVQGK
jgi:hypothetical protein